jgi:hypothetical protein
MSKTVITLSGQTLHDGVSSLQQNCLNNSYAGTPRTTPIEDILARVEKAVHSLPVEMTEDARQETVRIIKSFSRPTDAGKLPRKKAYNKGKVHYPD